METPNKSAVLKEIHGGVGCTGTAVCVLHCWQAQEKTSEATVTYKAATVTAAGLRLLSKRC